MKKKKFIKTLAMAVLLSGSMAMGGVPVHAAEAGENIETTVQNPDEKPADNTDATADETPVENTDATADEAPVENTDSTVDEAPAESDLSTVFPDANFRQYILSSFDTDKDGKLSQEELDAVTEIVVDGKDIESLEGIAQFQKLEKLYCANNKLSNLDVSKLGALTYLECMHNPLKSLNLAQNENLTMLACIDCQLTELDVSNNKKLEYLYCSDNEIEKLDVGNNPFLLILEVQNNKLNALDLTNNTSLYRLNMANNPVKDVFITNCRFLRKAAYEEKIIDGGVVTQKYVVDDAEVVVTKEYSVVYDEGDSMFVSSAQYTNDEIDQTIGTAMNPLKGIVISAYFPDAAFRQYVREEIDKDMDGQLSLDELKAVTSIKVSGRGIESLEGITQFANLEELICFDNKISNLDVSKLSALKTLDCWNNPLKNLDVTQNVNLEVLACENCQLTGLDVSKNTKLEYLYCPQNEIEKLDVSNNPLLLVLEVQSNKLTALDISKNTDLDSLNVSKNPISEVYITNCRFLRKAADEERIVKDQVVTHKYVVDDADVTVTKEYHLIYDEGDSMIVSSKQYVGDEIDQTIGTKTNPLKGIVISANFPDAAFRQYVRDEFDKDMDGQLSLDELKAVSEIKVGGSKIESLEGIERFEYLQVLFCFGNNISKLDLSKNGMLIRLDCSGNPIESLDLSNQKDLTSLICADCKLRVLDVSKNTKLDTLYVDKNPLDVIDVTNCPTLVKVVKEGVTDTKEIPSGVLKYILNVGYLGYNDSTHVITEKAFKDVEDGKWYNAAVSYVKAMGYMNGTSESTFEPATIVTRAQFITILHNIYGGKTLPTEAYNDKFTDVPKDIWYTQPVMWALKNGITSGVSETEFGSEQEITREQLATLLYKYADMVGTYGTDFDKKALDSFPDKTEISDWAQDAMSWAVSKGVISGKASNEGNILDPKGKATRAECAQMIMNFIAKNSKTGMAE